MIKKYKDQIESSDDTSPGIGKIKVVDPLGNPPDNGIRIMIDMDNTGNYKIQEWIDPGFTYDIDGFIFEIFKGPEGHL